MKNSEIERLNLDWKAKLWLKTYVSEEADKLQEMKVKALVGLWRAIGGLK